MQQVRLTAEARSEKGKEKCRKLRKQGLIPGVVYARDFAPINVSVPAKELQKVLAHGNNALVNLTIGKDQVVAMVSEVQRDLYQKVINHVDFHKVSLDETVSATVRINVIGRAAAEKTGGMLDVVLHEVDVEARPLASPDAIDVDVSNLELGASLHVRDLQVPAGVEVVTDADEVVVVLHTPVSESVASEAETPVPAAGAAAPDAV